MRLVRLREWRQRRGLSQEDLAERAEVGRAAISKYENVRREAHPSTATKIAQALSVEVEDLLYSPDMERPAWGRATGAVLDAAKERGELSALLERFADEAESGPGRSMYEAYRREAQFSQALRSLDVSRLPARSAGLLVAYAELVGSFVQAGVRVPSGLARSVSEVLAREGKEEKGE